PYPPYPPFPPYPPQASPAPYPPFPPYPPVLIGGSLSSAPPPTGFSTPLFGSPIGTVQAPPPVQPTQPAGQPVTPPAQPTQPAGQPATPTRFPGSDAYNVLSIFFNYGRYDIVDSTNQGLGQDQNTKLTKIVAAPTSLPASH